jgi:hypothetical protein
MERLELRPYTLDEFHARRDRRRRNQRISAGVVAIAVFVGAILIVTVGGLSDRAETPALTGPAPGPAPATERVGFIGLPPGGAAPSTPETGKLLISFYGRPGVGEGGGLYRLWVYADGRMIWDREGDFPYGANDVTTGYLEQRITPEAAELMRAEIVSTGLFERDLSLDVDPPFIWGMVRVREGGELVRVRWSLANNGAPTVMTRAQSRMLHRVIARLTHPAGWLQDAWVDRELRPYVASRYAVCYGPEIDTSAAFPDAARDLLQARDRTRWNTTELGGAFMYCSEMTTEEARALVALLDASELSRDDAYRLEYRLRSPDPPPVIFVEPYFPHGEFLLSQGR